jgi:peptidoglycan/LPS O-acetylase OafA/YrhL
MKATTSAAHMPQLDALRALAVAAVAISHWTPNFLVGIVPWGTGVQLFFVLSGFLITGILLRSRPADLGISMGTALRVFYTRRVLRIFPLYYGVLALCMMFSVGSIDSTWPWHVSYLSNIYYAWRGHGDAVSDPFLHLWSLSVEEQFYLLWPFIALILGRRSLVTFLYVSLVGSVAFRVGIANIAPEIPSIRYLTPSCVDAFSVGGLIAHAKHYAAWDGVRRIARWFAGIGCIGLFSSVIFLPRLINSADAHRIGHTFLVIIYGAVVAQAAVGFPGILGRILMLKPLLYLGKISYGIYVYHYFAAVAISALAIRLGFDAALQKPPLVLPAYVTFTLVMAVISWHLYELPINNLKRHFEYPQLRQVNPSIPPQVTSPISNG